MLIPVLVSVSPVLDGRIKVRGFSNVFFYFLQEVGNTNNGKSGVVNPPEMERVH